MRYLNVKFFLFLCIPFLCFSATEQDLLSHTSFYEDANMSENSYELVLYKRDMCPFCRKVFAKIESLQLNIEKRDISDATFLNELISVGGKKQVPCLLINGEPLYESDEIINWLEANQKDLSK